MIRSPEHIILYDGVCNLCTGAVRFVLQRDPTGHFFFASLQSDSGKSLLRNYPELTHAAESVVLIAQGQVFVRSDAVLRIVRQLSNGWKFLYFLIYVPRPLRDLLYRLVARFRNRFFGIRSSCLVSLPGWEERFLG